MKRITRALVAGVTACLATAGSGLSGASAATACPQGWGSLAEGTPAMSRATVEDVRAGRHSCFDRLVVDLSGPARGAYDVRYVPAVHAEGSGSLVPLRGAADLQIVVRAPAYDSETGAATYRPADRRDLVDVRGARTFRQVAWAGSFEGQTTVGLGVRARLPFRVMVLDGPATGSRLVVDVAHRW